MNPAGHLRGDQSSAAALPKSTSPESSSPESSSSQSSSPESDPRESDPPESTAPELTLPGYGQHSIADLLPGIAANVGVPGCRDVAGLPGSGRYLLILVDGLGWHQLRQAGEAAPYLAGLQDSARPLTATVPSTTATSLASLGTGLPPGQHGIVGYVSRIPGSQVLLNALSWSDDPDPRSYQPRPTVFERVADAGVAASSVSPRHFAGTGLTTAAQRGAQFIGYRRQTTDRERAELITQAVTRSPYSLVYAYEREVDHAGHRYGVGSPQWLQELRRVDRRCQLLAQWLPRDVCMLVTADHGMINVDSEHRIVVEDEPDLIAGIDAVGGEPRFRQLYIDHADPGLVARRWSDRLGELAWIRTRDQAIAEGWFGCVDAAVAERYGHVVVAMRNDWAIMTRTQPREMDVIGMHGSLSPAEMLVPLLTG